MKITVIGGGGLIGTKLVELFTADGHQVVAASRSTGLEVLTGAGLPEALADAAVLVDVTNSPSFADDDVMAFFTTSTTNLLHAARGPGWGTMSHCRSSAPTRCPAAATCAPRRPMRI